MTEQDPPVRVVKPFPDGHFYSPIPALTDVARDAHRLFGEPPRTLPGIDLNEAGQLDLLERLSLFYPDLPFPEQPGEHFRYYYENGLYSYSDAIFLYSMIRHARPKRIVEVGSGHSSCVVLDTNERFFNDTVRCTFIEPYAQRLFSLIRPQDRAKVEIIERRVQDVDLNVFRSLEANDILFIDSTHVAKIGSDVNHLLFEVLPRLASGVYVHFHDIFHPFEYPREWIFEGRAWNEAYMVRAFLLYNSAFEVALFNTFLSYYHQKWFARRMPLCLKNPGGSLWLRRRPG